MTVWKPKSDIEISKMLIAVEDILLPSMQSPKVQPEYVFCRDALRRVGAAMFGEKWTDTDMMARQAPFHSPAVVYERFWKSQLDAIESWKRMPSLPLSFSSRSFDQATQAETQDEFVKRKAESSKYCEEKQSNIPAEVSKLQSNWQLNVDASKRLLSAAGWLGDKCRSGAIRGAFQYKGLPKIYDAMDKQLWNGTSDLDRWARDGGYPEFLNGHKYQTMVFVLRDDLEREIAALAHAPLLVKQEDLSKLSPDLQLAVRVALNKELFRTGSAKDGAVQTWIVAAAKAEGRTIATTKLKQMSAVMRYPDNPIRPKAKN